MTKPLLLLLLLPLPALAAAIDASAAALQTAETVYTVGLVGGSVFGIYAALGAFRYVREVIGVASPFDTSRDLSPHVRGYVDQASYLEALGQRLAAENDAASMAAEREEIFLTAADHQSGEQFSISDEDYSASMRQDAVDAGADMALYDRFLSQDATHDEALRWSVEAASGEIRLPVLPTGIDPIEEAALAAVNVHQWQADDRGKFRTHVINVNGTDRFVRIDFNDELNDAREEARSNASRSDGLTNADLMAMKEVSKDHDSQAMRGT